MSFDLNEFEKKLTALLEIFDRKNAGILCNEFIEFLYASSELIPYKNSEKILQRLRSKRMFDLMQKVGDALIQTGRHTYKIRRQYAQALIDQNNLTGAIAVLKELVTDTSNASSENEDAKFENSEARGLSGRVYKQLYVNAGSPGAIHSVNFIKEAIKFYLDVYISEPQLRTWHGINAVALLKRATGDNIEFAGYPSADELAKSVLQTIKERYEIQKADAWDFATAAEACLALNKPNEALEWMSGYARMPYCDAFELASTLRQLEEVWRLNMDSETGKLLLPLLRAELIKREGGNFSIGAGELREQKAAEDEISSKYSSLIKEQDKSKPGVKLEKLFGNDSFLTYKMYMKGADRCLGVARIGRDSSTGFGTGFLLKGSALNESLGEELVIITNAHVVSNDPAEKALRPGDAIIIFEALDRDEEFRGQEIIWSSPSNVLDATVIRLNKESQDRLKELTKGIKIYPVSPYLPEIDPVSPKRIYIIGHPYGGTLRLSCDNNIFLDYQDPKIHYRTATDEGSSGSPVFDQQWDLIGLHHAGSKEMPCLNEKPGTYEANEGIWIQSIIKAMK